MAERDISVFKGINIGDTQAPVRDYNENPQVIEQGVLQPGALDRIKKAEKGELKARLAVILDRGIIDDRLKVDLPDGIYGMWARNDPLEVKRLEGLGFMLDNTYATDRAIHSDGSSSAIIGDVVHMICPMEVKEIIDEIRHEQLLKAHMKKREKRGHVNREEKDFIENVKGEGDKYVTGFSESNEKSASFDDIKEAVLSIDSQIVPFSDS